MIIRMKLGKAFIIYTLFLICPYLSFGQAFEGTITYKNESLTDTAFLTYSIRQNLIRIDEANSEGTIVQSTLVDLVKKTVTAVNPQKKLYTDIYPSAKSHKSASDFEIKRTGNVKEINGYKCHQWRVRNKSANSEVAYWVAEADFEFYDDLLHTIPLHENKFTFYLNIPKTDGFLPLHVCERTLLRDVKNVFTVTEIRPKALDESLFQVPIGYQEFKQSR